MKISISIRRMVFITYAKSNNISILLNKPTVAKIREEMKESPKREFSRFPSTPHPSIVIVRNLQFSGKDASEGVHFAMVVAFGDAPTASEYFIVLLICIKLMIAKCVGNGERWRTGENFSSEGDV